MLSVVFGVDLTTLVKLEGGVIPKVLSDLFTEIQSRGNHYYTSIIIILIRKFSDLSVEGIYRVSGQTSEVADLKEKYDEGELVSFTYLLWYWVIIGTIKPLYHVTYITSNLILIPLGEEVDWSQYLDISILAGAVKLYLRELPIPLITFDAYKAIMKATAAISDPEIPDVDWQSFTRALKLLPSAHLTTLKHLSQHLYRYTLIHSHVVEKGYLKYTEYSYFPC